MTKTRILKELKKAFLDSEGINSPQKSENLAKARRHSLKASVEHNKTYKDRSDKDNEKLREYWHQLLIDIAEQYRKGGVDPKEHCRNILSLRKKLSDKHGRLLAGGKLRVGAAQKSLNLYLKYLWCMEEIDTPPHCTVDRVILEEVHKHNKVPAWKKKFPSWTKCDDIREYEGWIREIDKVEKKPCVDSLALWELIVWNANKKPLPLR